MMIAINALDKLLAPDNASSPGRVWLVGSGRGMWSY